MIAIPHELLAQIANPTGSDNVLQMFMQAQQQAMQNDEWVPMIGPMKAFDITRMPGTNSVH